MAVTLIADLIFVLIGALIIWRCVSNGFIKCLFKFVRTLLAVAIAWLLIGPVAPFIGEKFIEEPVYDFVYDKIDEVYQDTAGSFDASTALEEFPEYLATDDIKEKLEDMDGSGEELVASISEELSAPVISIISSVIAFVAVFILAFIGLTIALFFLNALIEKIKFIRLANKILGGVWGLAVACVFWFFIASGMNLFMPSSDLYANSYVIKFFGDIHLIEKLGITENIAEWALSKM